MQATPGMLKQIKPSCVIFLVLAATINSVLGYLRFTSKEKAGSGDISTGLIGYGLSSMNQE